MNNNNKVFCYSDVKNAKILLGAYRSEKDQLSWIVGLKTHRYEKLYNVRLNNDIFSTRNGGILSYAKPDYILIYDTANPNVGYHLFPCISQSIKREDEMQVLKYPTPNGDYMVYLLGDEIQAEAVDIPRLMENVEQKNPGRAKHSPTFICGFDVAEVVIPQSPLPAMVSIQPRKVLRIIDLFAGIGGIRKGVEQAAAERGIETVCVFTSEIKSHAIKVLQDNHPAETIHGDITKVSTNEIPDFDILCAGFPCQAFSAAGKRQGFDVAC